MKMKYLLTVFLMAASVCHGSPQGVPSESTVVVGLTPVTALPANKDRGYLIIQNNGVTGFCQIRFSTAIVGTEGIILAATQNYEPNGAFVKSPVYMRCSVSSSIVFVEANF